MAKGKAATRSKPKRAAVAPNLKRPRPGDSGAIADLKVSRTLLLKKMQSRGISARDLATISAELRKVNATLSIVENAGKSDHLAEEDLAQRAALVRAQLLKTKAARDGLRVAQAEAEEASAVEDDDEPEADTG